MSRTLVGVTCEAPGACSVLKTSGLPKPCRLHKGQGPGGAPGLWLGVSLEQQWGRHLPANTTPEAPLFSIRGGSEMPWGPLLQAAQGRPGLCTLMREAPLV